MRIVISTTSLLAPNRHPHYLLTVSFCINRDPTVFHKMYQFYIQRRLIHYSSYCKDWLFFQSKQGDLVFRCENASEYFSTNASNHSIFLFDNESDNSQEEVELMQQPSPSQAKFIDSENMDYTSTSIKILTISHVLFFLISLCSSQILGKRIWSERNACWAHVRTGSNTHYLRRIWFFCEVKRQKWNRVLQDGVGLL